MPHGDSGSQLDRNASHHSQLPRLLPAALAVLAIGFAVGCVVQLRFALFSFFTTPGHSMLNAWVRPILYGTFGLLAFLFFHATIRLVHTAIHASSRHQRRNHPPAKSVEQFIEEAGRLHIAPRIARETFQLFASLVPQSNSIDLHDDLRTQLGLTNPQISSLLSSLPELCDRANNPADVTAIHTVYDLLHHIESAPAHKSGQYDLRNGAPIQATSTSPLADLKNASPRDSRFRTRAHFSGLKRRASDYSGPYRRSTDRKPDLNYSGPLRRVSDRKPADLQSIEGQPPRTHDSRITDTRILERRSSSHQVAIPQEPTSEARQHKAVQVEPSQLKTVSTDTGLLNARIDPPRPQNPQLPERAMIAASETTPKPSLHRR